MEQVWVLNYPLSAQRRPWSDWAGVQQWRKSNAHQRETTVSSNDSLQLRPFSKWELLLKERICSQRERSLSFKSSSLRYGNHFNHIRWAPLSVNIFISTCVYCVMGATLMSRLIWFFTRHVHMSDTPPPLKNHKNIGFLSNTGPDPLKNHKTTKPAFNVGSSSARQRNAI